jgi:ribonuclease T1
LSGLWRRIVAALFLAFVFSVPQAVALGDAPGEPAAAEVAADALPAEARATLRLIDRGGPFPYDRDGVEFRNFEKRLPLKPRGYYREYTVRTPGVKHRGARRIVAGAAGELYYTEDHYQSFRRIRR